ncbi:hypothetical protein BKA65DRAFT_558137 [Rhexocercosporidium sp. MPI-PUGE-AT-0058]|nr:hypothetical protein BKA65DRAFT_558137 [Rhexocercosporidium sp. MPI-PUGE-AT-0058]
MSTPSRKRPPKKTCLTCFLTDADSCNYGSIPGWCRQCQTPHSSRQGIFRSLFSHVPLAFALLIFQARTRCPLGINAQEHNILEFRTPFVEIGTGTCTLNIMGDLSSSDPSHRAQMDRIVGEIYSTAILCKKPSAKDLTTALMLRSYLSALSGFIFIPRPIYDLGNYHNVENGSEIDLCIQVFYFFLGRIDDILSEIFAACSKDVKTETEEYWGSVTAAVAIAYTGMVDLRQDLGHKDLKMFYGVEQSRELVAHLQYQIQTSTERLLLLLREQCLGCDSQWHEYLEDASQLRGASNSPTVTMTLKNRWVPGDYAGSDSGLNSITVGWEPQAGGTLLTDLETNPDASMNTPGSSTFSEGHQDVINWQSPFPTSSILDRSTQGHNSPAKQDDGCNSFPGTFIRSYMGMPTEHPPGTRPHQSYANQYLSPYTHSDASPNTQYPNSINWNNSSHHQSINMGQPTPGDLSLDLNIPPPRPEEVSSVVASSADTISNPEYVNQQSLGTVPYLSGRPNDSPPQFSFFF